MDPLTIAAIAAPVVGGLLGQKQASDAQANAERLRQDALAQYAGINIPDEDKMKLALQNYQLQGTLTPEMEQALSQGPTAYENIQVDPRLKADQMQALEQMSGLASGQVKPSDVAGFEMARRGAAAEAQAKQGQILQEMQQRGQAGSGAELLSKLTAAQSAADRQQQAQLQQAQAMQQAREQAISNLANMAGNIRNQDYSQASDLARARDIVAQQNIANSRDVQSRNVAAKNLAAASNLANKQNLSNANVDIANKQQQYNKGLAQQTFNNQMTKASGLAGQYTGQATAAQQAGADQAAATGKMAQGLGTMLGAWGANQQKPAEKKPTKTASAGAGYLGVNTNLFEE